MGINHVRFSAVHAKHGAMPRWWMLWWWGHYWETQDFVYRGSMDLLRVQQWSVWVWGNLSRDAISCIRLCKYHTTRICLTDRKIFKSAWRKNLQFLERWFDESFIAFRASHPKIDTLQLNFKANFSYYERLNDIRAYKLHSTWVFGRCDSFVWSSFLHIPGPYVLLVNQCPLRKYID